MAKMEPFLHNRAGSPEMVCSRADTRVLTALSGTPSHAGQILFVPLFSFFFFVTRRWWHDCIDFVVGVSLQHPEQMKDEIQDQTSEFAHIRCSSMFFDILCPTTL